MNSDTTKLIQIKELCKVYKTPAGEVNALANINAEFARGEFIGIVGKSGAGKSTLISMVSGVDRYTSGEIMISNTKLHEMNEDELAQWRGKNIGVVYQSFELLNQLSILDNVLLPIELCGHYHPIKSKKWAMELLEKVEIAEHAHKPPTMISGGQQQRAAIARALANDPPILAADEPTGNLDSKTGATILKLFQELAASGKTILMVTHDQHIQAEFDRRYLIKDGQLSEISNPAWQNSDAKRKRGKI